MPHPSPHPPHPHAPPGADLLHGLLAALLSAAVTLIAATGTFFTTAPEAVSLTFEPLSLLLMPGMLCGMVLNNINEYLRHRSHHGSTHDYTPEAVLFGSLIFYFIFFCYALRWWSRYRAHRALTLPPRSG